MPTNELFFDKKIKCLYCDHEFTTPRIRQRQIRMIKQDADFCPYFKGENPLFYEVNVCPHCGFAFTDRFSAILDKKRKNLKEQYIDKIKIPKACEERTIECAIRFYKLALFAATLLDQSLLIQANLCMRIAWLNRYHNNEQEEKRFLRNALDIYLEVYQRENLDRIEMDKYLLIYMIGELYGRLGEYEKMRRWFSILLSDQMTTPKVLEITRERWREYKMQHDLEGDIENR
ncbi:DUF2225 domain-containing protein [Tepidibacillus fermentans]|uniref:DUF2225 domain-containing protein n=1 Tax=Tepidibacillus fermentans TaxID=1281767 RepID=A0A4R3KDN8_9BACI|nr:DUF2225 domain-containing protein [Tepidibacillus fermentans]TCS81069.1 hypothetical protein EDD72_11451 [Tepidibacillus fermentans]